jgi:hypothetical protein
MDNEGKPVQQRVNYCDFEGAGELDRIAAWRGGPQTIVSDNGTELTSTAILCPLLERKQLPIEKAEISASDPLRPSYIFASTSREIRSRPADANKQRYINLMHGFFIFGEMGVIWAAASIPESMAGSEPSTRGFEASFGQDDWHVGVICADTANNLPNP